MGNSNSSVETSSINKIYEIDIEALDLSSIDKLQLKAIKQLNEKLIKIEKEKSNRMIYTLPRIDLCNMSLF